MRLVIIKTHLGTMGKGTPLAQKWPEEACGPVEVTLNALTAAPLLHDSPMGRKEWEMENAYGAAMPSSC